MVFAGAISHINKIKNIRQRSCFFFQQNKDDLIQKDDFTQNCHREGFYMSKNSYETSNISCLNYTIVNVRIRALKMV